MANIFDVANYILSKHGSISAMKLQKLCYYSQAWNLVWDEQPLFNNRIEAWENGPVAPDLYDWHRGQFIVNTNDGLISKCDDNLTNAETETIDCVLRDYKQYTAQQLSDLTHQETPWKTIYNKHKDSCGRCGEEITTALMHEYYSGLQEVDGEE